jgi:hypothetical protein
VFDLDAVEAEAAFEPFRFRLGGRAFTLPHLRMLDRRVVAAADQGDFAAMDAAFRQGLGEDYEAFNQLPLSLHALDALFRGWLEHSGLAPGESPASPRS